VNFTRKKITVVGLDDCATVPQMLQACGVRAERRAGVPPRGATQALPAALATIGYRRRYPRQTPG
jgi:hypothetical protein